MGAVLAVATSEALAADWHVNGTLLAASSSAEIEFQLPKIDASIILDFSVGGTNDKVLCGSVSIVGRIFGLSKVWMKIVYAKCHTIPPTPTNCNLTGGQTELTSISTVPLLGEAKSSTRGSLKPETGKLFGELPFQEGQGCAVEGNVPVKGELVDGWPTGGEEREAQTIVGLGSEENNSLEAGSGNKGFLLGKVLLKLWASDLWSFR
jgi:hypothetical protein